MVTEVEARAQVAGSVDAFDAKLQVRLTGPLKPPDGVTVTVDVLPVVAPGLTSIPALLESVTPGELEVPVTLTVTGVVWVMLPDIPVTVTVYAPPVVPLCVATVRMDCTAAVPVMSTGLCEKEQVGTSVPVVGVTAQVSVTSPVNPPDGVAVMVAVLPVVAFAAMEMLPLFESRKLGVAAAAPVTTAWKPSV
jgi:hypothetical protein